MAGDVYRVLPASVAGVLLPSQSFVGRRGAIWPPAVVPPRSPPVPAVWLSWDHPGARRKSPLLQEFRAMALWKEQVPPRKEPVPTSPAPVPQAEATPRVESSPSYDMPRRATVPDIKE